MARLNSLAFLAAFAWQGLAAGNAAAEMIQWSYTSLPSQLNFQNGSGLDNAITSQGIFMGGGSSSALMDQRGSAKVGVASLLTFNFSSAGDPPAVFAFQAPVPFTLDISLVDRASQKSGQLIFSAAFDPLRSINGVVTGYADEGTRLSSMTISFPGPTIQSLVLGPNRYTVSLIPPNPLLHWNPDPSRPGFEGGIDAHVDVSPASAAATPEPSCLVLAGMGLLTVAGAAWRKRRGKAGSASRTQRAA
jgi:hypothetical protein